MLRRVSLTLIAFLWRVSPSWATAHQYNTTAANTITTTGTCAAGKIMHVRLKRDAGHASDTLPATAMLVGLSLKMREAQ